MLRSLAGKGLQDQDLTYPTRLQDMPWPDDLPSLYVFELYIPRLYGQRQIRWHSQPFASACWWQFISTSAICAAARRHPRLVRMAGPAVSSPATLVCYQGTDWQHCLFCLRSLAICRQDSSLVVELVITTLSIRLSCLSGGWTDGSSLSLGPQGPMELALQSCPFPLVASGARYDLTLESRTEQTRTGGGSTAAWA